MDLNYRSFVGVEALNLNECTIHRAGRRSVLDGGPRWWNLWCRVLTVAGVPKSFVVPINPGGGYVEAGPGGRTWGFTQTGPGVWRVAPSIDAAVWHQTPAVVGVPEGEPWVIEAP